MQKVAGNHSRPPFYPQWKLVVIAAFAVLRHKTVSSHNGINPFRKKVMRTLVCRFSLGNRRNGRAVNKSYDKTRSDIFQTHSFDYPADSSIKTNAAGAVGLRHRARFGSGKQLHIMRCSRSYIRRHTGRQEQVDHMLAARSYVHLFSLIRNRLGASRPRTHVVIPRLIKKVGYGVEIIPRRRGSSVRSLSQRFYR